MIIFDNNFTSIHADGNTANDKRQWRPLPFAGGNGMTATTAMSFWQKLRFLTKMA